jgi:predicted acylesterase/phospholipase RssA
VTPVCIDNKCYIDGGMVCNYPLNYCINAGKKTDEILGFKNKYTESQNCLTDESNIVDFLLNFLFKAVFCLNTDHIQPSVKYEVICNADYLNLNVLKTALNSMDVRQNIFNTGIETATTFLSKLKDSI